MNVHVVNVNINISKLIFTCRVEKCNFRMRLYFVIAPIVNVQLNFSGSKKITAVLVTNDLITEGNNRNNVILIVNREVEQQVSHLKRN